MPQSDESKEQEEIELSEEIDGIVPVIVPPEESMHNLPEVIESVLADKEIPVVVKPEPPVQIPAVKKEKREKGESRAGFTKPVYHFSVVKKARKLAKKQRARNRRG